MPSTLVSGLNIQQVVCQLDGCDPPNDPVFCKLVADWHVSTLRHDTFPFGSLAFESDAETFNEVSR